MNIARTTALSLKRRAAALAPARIRRISRVARIAAALTRPRSAAARMAATAATAGGASTTPFSAQYARAFGGMTQWTPPEYGEYYPRSAMVYAAVKVRQDAIARLPLRVVRQTPPARRRADTDAPVYCHGHAHGHAPNAHGYAHNAHGHAHDAPGYTPGYAHDAPPRYSPDAPEYAHDAQGYDASRYAPNAPGYAHDYAADTPPRYAHGYAADAPPRYSPDAPGYAHDYAHDAPPRYSHDAPGYAHDAPPRYAHDYAADTPPRYAHDAPPRYAPDAPGYAHDYAADAPPRYAPNAPGYTPGYAPDAPANAFDTPSLGYSPLSPNARASGEPVGADHPLQRLLDAPNPFWTRGDLWRATETHLSLWGAAFWALERDEHGAIREIWPLRPDRMRIIPDANSYIKGFVFVGDGSQLAPYIPEDIVWMRYFNPLDEYAGLSPIAPLRLSADMGLDALRANRKLLQNDSAPGLIIETDGDPTDAEVHAFFQRWESRYQGVEKLRRPALLGAGMKATNLGFSPRDMEYIESLRWSLEDIARVFGVPKMMIGDMEHTTYSNFSAARRLFWEDTVSAQLALYQDALQRYLLPHFGDPALRVEFDLSGVEALKESEASKAKRRRLYVQAGIMTVNEARREIGLPARD